MLRLYRNSPRILNLCKLIINKRYQSVANVALEPNLSQISILSGHIKGEITHKLEFILPEKHTPISIYQVLDSEGNVNDKNHTLDVSKLI
jgi:hypothetical protein